MKNNKNVIRTKSTAKVIRDSIIASGISIAICYGVPYFIGKIDEYNSERKRLRRQEEKINNIKYLKNVMQKAFSVNTEIQETYQKEIDKSIEELFDEEV